MNYLKIFLIVLSLFVFSLFVKPANADIVSDSSAAAYTSGNYTEYVYIDDRLYEVVYSDDGKIIIIQPIE